MNQNVIVNQNLSNFYQLEILFAQKLLKLYSEN